MWVLLLLAAIAVFLMRGPWRAWQQSGDFAPAYLSTRLWLAGSNPYNHAQFAALWQVAGGPAGQAPTLETTPSVYPPTTFVVLAPLALLPWGAARALLLAINVALTLLAIGALARVADLPWRDWQGRCFWVFAVAFAPLHSGLATGNLIVIAASCALLAVWAASQKREWAAGLLLGVSLCVKPPIGGAVWLAYALRGRWRLTGVAGGAAFVIALIALAPLVAHRVPWQESLLASHASAIAPGGVNDPTAANPSRHHLLNLQRLLFTVWTAPRLVNAVTLGVIALLFAAWLWANRRTTQRELLSVGALATISLLPVYHRFYDALILLLPLAWSLAAWQGGWRKQARFAMLCLTLLFVPGAALLHEAMRAGCLPAAWATTWWWNVVLMSHQVWAVLLLAVVLLWALVKKANGEASAA